ncbi:MAG: FtsK/SpoIIIE domain-containing protein [Actinomycetia bacterium]|nr:FtsK/SpoIIIE domain-containing protein [Actinomycetes bacterium]
MRICCTIETGAGGSQDVYIDAEPDATVGQLRDALAPVPGLGGGPAAGGGGGTGLLWVYDRLADGAMTLTEAGVRAGVVLSLRGATRAQPPQAAGERGWQLHVVGGPDAGTVFDLPIGAHVIGRADGLLINDPAVSRRHLLLTVTADGANAVDLGSGNGSLLDGAPLPRQGEGGPVAVRPDQVLHLGDSLLAIRAASRQTAAVHVAEDGALELTRPPRIRPRRAPVRVSVPQAPAKRAGRKLPVIAILTPVLLSVIMALTMHRMTYLLLAAATPAMAIGNWVSQRRESRQGARREWDEYQTAAAQAQEDARREQAAETAARRADSPDLAEIIAVTTAPRPRLWERRATDDDFLTLRLGSAHRPAELAIVAAGSRDEEHPTLQDVPVSIELATAGVAGVAGPPDLVNGVARALLAQLAARHTPRDVRVCLLSTAPASRQQDQWGWLRWLPHLAGDAPGEPLALVGADSESTAARVGELAELVKARQRLKGGSVGAAVVFAATVVVLDGARALRGLPGVQAILADGPAVGVYSLCLEAEQRLLPEECRTLIVPEPGEPAQVRLVEAAGPGVEAILADQLSLTHAEDISRALSPLRDRGRDEGDVNLPDSARLLEIINLDPPKASAIQAGWVLAPRSTSFVLGAGIGGPFRLDLRADGPHGLIAGTTGSGKSELLQTMVASLSIANRPDSINFVLVDYKGGSAFKDCVRLPHTVGMVTDLNAHLVERALASLGAELRYREHQLAAIGAKDIEDYTELRDRDGGVPALPRLVIVIDEFASMVRDLPNFVTGLVNLAQRGRSLGIHLLLATQRPSGAVSPEIRANTNLRVSLRVLDPGDSTDVLEAPDAARIPASAPGRGYARLGHGSLAPFQAGRVGGRRPGARVAEALAPFVAPLGWAQYGYAPPKRPAGGKAAVQADDTDLAALVAAVREANDAAGIPAQRRPWLDALPDLLLLDEIAPPASGAEADQLRPIVFGRTDLPSEQAQLPASIDLNTFGHQYLVGGPRSGRSQFLRTLAASVARTTSVRNAHIYGIDCGTGALNALLALPHCAVVVGRVETERAGRLLNRLSAEIERRQQLLATGNWADISEQRRAVPPDERLPHILLMIDRWEAFVPSIGSLDNDRYTNLVMTMLREGASVGLHLIIAGDRSLVVARMAALTENKLVLRLPDRDDYSMAGVPSRSIPEELAPGRAFAGDNAIETQIALLDPDIEGAAQARAVTAIGERAQLRDAAVPPALRPFRLDAIPARIDLDAALALPRADGGTMWLPVGVGGDELSIYGVDLAERAPTFLIAGPPKSGRSNALAVLAGSLAAAGAELVLGVAADGPLAPLTGMPQVRGLVNPATDEQAWESLLAEPAPGWLVVLLDDAERYRDAPGKNTLHRLAREAPDARRGLIVAGSPDGLGAGLSGWPAELRGHKQGLLLSPRDFGPGELVGIRLSPSAIGGPVVPGRGLLVATPGQLAPVQVPVWAGPARSGSAA